MVIPLAPPPHTPDTCAVLSAGSNNGTACNGNIAGTSVITTTDTGTTIIAGGRNVTSCDGNAADTGFIAAANTGTGISAGGKKRTAVTIAVVTLSLTFAGNGQLRRIFLLHAGAIMATYKGICAVVCQSDVYLPGGRGDFKSSTAACDIHTVKYDIRSRCNFNSISCRCFAVHGHCNGTVVCYG